MLDWVNFWISAVFIARGLLSLCIAMYGVYKFSYLLNRMHAAAIGDTMGVMSVIIGLMFYAHVNFASLKLILLLIILWLSVPVSGHLIARLEIETSYDIHAHMEVDE